MIQIVLEARFDYHANAVYSMNGAEIIVWLISATCGFITASGRKPARRWRVGMSRWIVPPDGLIEPVPASELYTDGIGAIELIGDGNIRLHMICDQMPFDGPVSQRVVVAKLIRPISSVPTSIGQLAQCLLRAEPPSRGPRLVK